MLARIIKALYYRFCSQLKPSCDRLIRFMISSEGGYRYSELNKEFSISRNILEEFMDLCKSDSSIKPGGSIKLYGYDVNILEEDNIIKFHYKDSVAPFFECKYKDNN